MRRSYILFLTILPFLVTAVPALATLVPTWSYQTMAPILSTPKMADLDRDAEKEIVVTTYSTNPANPYDGGYVYVFQADGAVRPGWPYYSDGSPFPATPAIGDLDGNGTREVVVGSWSQLFVFHADGSIAAGFPRPYGTSETAALYDLDGDGELEILYPSNNRLYLMDRNGTVLPGWPYTIQATYYIGSPVIGDIDHDGQVEIVAGSYKGPVDATPFNVYAWEIDGSLVPGWPFPTSGVIKACPALGDADGDGDVEIAVGAYDTSNNDFFYLLQGDGTLMSGWPQRAGRNRLSPPGFADLDGVGNPEIVVGGGTANAPYYGQLFAFSVDGSVVSGFPIQLPAGGQVNDAPIVLDLDGDPARLEILVKNQDHIHGYHSDGTVIADFPFVLNDQGHSGTTSPGALAGDVDGDGDVELVFCSNYDAVYFFDSYGPFAADLAFWPTYKHDGLNTGNLGTREVAGMDEDVPDVLSDAPLSCSPNPFRGLTRIELTSLGGAEPISLVVLDAAGRRVRTLEPHPIHGGLAAVEWDGRDAAGRFLPVGTYFLKVGESRATRRVVLLR